MVRQCGCWHYTNPSPPSAMMEDWPYKVEINSCWSVLTKTVQFVISAYENSFLMICEVSDVLIIRPQRHETTFSMIILITHAYCFLQFQVCTPQWGYTLRPSDQKYNLASCDGAASRKGHTNCRGFFTPEYDYDHLFFSLWFCLGVKTISTVDNGLQQIRAKMMKYCPSRAEKWKRTRSLSFGMIAFAIGQS